jgi:hypothetical protein
MKNDMTNDTTNNMADFDQKTPGIVQNEASAEDTHLNDNLPHSRPNAKTVMIFAVILAAVFAVEHFSGAL